MRTATPSARIGSIRFSGNTVVPVPQLLHRLRLQSGERFDFYRWQQDRDGLRRFFLDRGFLEARISARQAQEPDPTGSPRIALEYNVEPGPPTSLVVDGHPLPATIIRELETEWSNAVVPIALGADMQSVVTAHLAEQGYLRAGVQVSRRPDANGAVVMHVQVEPGARATSRRLRIVGNQQFSAQYDRRARRAPRHQRVAQTDDAGGRPRVGYRQQGLLNARVTAGPLVFEGDAAILPIRIDEGLPFGSRACRSTARGTAPKRPRAATSG